MLVFLAHIIGYDLWFYVSHLLLHTRFLKRFHDYHHTFAEPKWPDTYRGHWFESAFQSVGYGLPFLFGLWSPWETVLAIVVINAKGIARHDRRTAWLVDGGHHLQHHKNPSVNFGEPWIDWVFGTRAQVTHK